MARDTTATDDRFAELRREINALKQQITYAGGDSVALVQHRRREITVYTVSETEAVQDQSQSANLHGVSSAGIQRPSAQLTAASRPGDYVYGGRTARHHRHERQETRLTIVDGLVISPIAKAAEVELIPLQRNMVQPPERYWEGMYCIRIHPPEGANKRLGDSITTVLIWIPDEDKAYLAMHRILWAIEEPRVATAEIDDLCPKIGTVVPDRLEVEG